MSWTAFIKWINDWLTYFAKAVRGDSTRDDELKGLILQVLNKLDKINAGNSDAVLQQLSLIIQKVDKMSAELDALKASYEEFKTVVTNDLTALLQKVADLQAQIDSAPSDTQGIKDLAAEVAADLQAAKDRIPD